MVVIEVAPGEPSPESGPTPATNQPTTIRGQAIDLRAWAVDVKTIKMAVQDKDTAEITVHCPDPGAVHDRVGIIRENRSYPVQTAFAMAARRRGYTAPQDATIQEINEQLAAMNPPAQTATEQRRQVAEQTLPPRLRERADMLRGRIRGYRDRDEKPDAIMETFRDTVAELAERRTAKAAAKEDLDQQRATLRTIRDQLTRRLHLQDRRDNLKRDARQHLAAAVTPLMRRAVAAVPGTCTVNDDGTVTGDETTAALAACRIAPLQAPVIVACDRFLSATTAAATLDAPVILV